VAVATLAIILRLVALHKRRHCSLQLVFDLRLGTPSSFVDIIFMSSGSDFLLLFASNPIGLCVNVTSREIIVCCCLPIDLIQISLPLR